MNTELTPWPLPSTTEAGHRLIAAACDLFYRNGIGAVGVDLIAETARVTKRTLYQRFRSKDALVVAYLQRRAHDWQTALLNALTEAPSRRHPVQTVFATAQRWADGNPRGCAFINAWAELGTTDHPAVDVITAEKQWMRELFAGLIDDESVTQAVHLLYEGAHVLSTTLSDPSAFRTAGDTAMALIKG